MPGRGTGETNITGGVFLQTNGVALDGVEISGASFHSQGLTRDTRLLIGGNGAVIQHVLFAGDGRNGSDVRPFDTLGSCTGFVFDHNRVENWAQGGAAHAGAAGTFSNNVFDHNANAIIVESLDVVIDTNTFIDSWGAHIEIGVDAASFDASHVLHANNVHDQDVGETDRILTIYPNAGSNVPIIGSDLGDRLAGEFYSGPLDFSGGGGRDYAVGTNSKDVLRGDAGDDHVIGGGGNDILVGGADNDFLEGGSGIDTAVYTAASTQATWVRNADGSRRSTAPSPACL